VDAAVQVGAGFQTRDDFTLIKVPLGAVFSRGFPLEGKREVVPYGGVYLVMDFFDVAGDNESELDVELRLGASAEIVDRAALFAAFHTGNGTLFFLGFNASL
jgi:hypothetical protein